MALHLSQEIISQRKIKGLSQEALANSSGISLRTIQRIENRKVIPRLHTLKVLCDILDLDFETLNAESEKDHSLNGSGLTELKLINLISLASIFLPFVHVLIQTLVWRKNRSNSIVDFQGRRLISMQIAWSLLLFISLLLVPVLSLVIDGQTASGHFPTPMVVYLAFILLNIIFVILNAVRLERGNVKTVSFTPALF